MATSNGRGSGGARRLPLPLRRPLFPVLPLAGGLMVCETTMFGALAPLLPEYADELGATTQQTAVLVGAFAAGVVVGAVVGGYTASRVGGRRTLLVAAALLALATVAFGASSHILLLDVSRGLQGVAGGAVWTGALTWVSAIAPKEQKATATGWVLGVAVAGGVIGPPVGALAVATSTTVVFGGIACLIVALLVGCARQVDPGGSITTGNPLRLAGPTVRWATARATWTMLVPSAGIGVLFAVVPLHLDAAGAGAAAVALVFLLASVCDGIVTPTTGRLADTRGVDGIARAATAVAAVAFGLLALDQKAWVTGLLTIAAVVGCAMFNVPASVRWERAVERAGIGAGYAYSGFVLCFAGGQMIGAVVAAVFSDRAGSTTPFAAIAATFGVTLVASMALRRRRTAPPAAGLRR